MSEPTADTAATEAAIPETMPPAPTAEPTIEERLAALESQAQQAIDANKALAAEIATGFAAIAAHMSSAPTPPQGVVRYDGPSDSINIDIRKGETFLVNQRLEALLAPLQARGHTFTPID